MSDIFIYKLLFFVGFISFFQNSPSQNLIINPSFEDTVTDLPLNILATTTFIRCVGWNEIRSADYFWYGNKNELRREKSYVNLKAHTGNCFAGFAVKTTNENTIYFREYIIGTFQSPLIQNCKYSIKIYVKPSSKNKFALKDIDILCTEAVFKPDSSLESRIITLTKVDAEETGWALYKGEYRALGHEKFLAIGYLRNTLKYIKNKTKEGKSNKNVIYTFIDDVSVIQDSNSQQNIIKTETDSILIPEIALKVKSLYFDIDKSNLDTSYNNYLDRLIPILISNPKLILNIYGYADTTGKSDYNMELSLKRAKVVADYFTDRGIDASRIAFYGEGVNTEKNAPLKALRKVEINISRASEKNNNSE